MRQVRSAVLLAGVLVAAAAPGGATAAGARRPASHRALTPAAHVRPSSAWQRPALADPETIMVSNRDRNLVLNQHRDYVLRCARRPVRLTWPLVVWGGHNIAFAHCALDIVVRNWAAQFKDQTGTLWIDGVRFGGRRLTGGVQLQEPRATVVMRDTLFDTVHGSYRTNHAECLQTWSGPVRLLIDGLTCSTTYQGLFLLPNQWNSTTHETVWDLRNIDITATGAYALWVGNAQPTQRGSIRAWHVSNLHVTGPGEPRNWDGTGDGDTAWRGVLAGSPAGGHYVRAVRGGAAGVDGRRPPLPLAGERPAR